MGDPYTSDAAEFLVGTLFGIYILLVMLRCLFQIVRADFYNPLSQFVVKVTNPPLRPLRNFIPVFYGVDTASVILMFFCLTSIVASSVGSSRVLSPCARAYKGKK